MSAAYRHSSTVFDTEYGTFALHCFSWSAHEEDNVLCAVKEPLGDRPLVRVQSACYTAEIFHSTDCDCREQLALSLARVAAEGGIVVYMLCDGRGAGLQNKIQGLELGRTRGLDTSDAYEALGIPQDPREYDRAAEVLRSFGATEIRLLTNNPRKLEGLRANGVDCAREPIEIRPTSGSRAYLETKARKMGHLIDIARYGNSE